MELLLESCKKEGFAQKVFDVNFDGKVLIIGAGAAGLTAGHVLRQHGVDFEIIEASSIYGGRIKETNTFADFPIDLGAEWIHTDPDIFAEILNDPTVNATMDIIKYRPDDFEFWDGKKLSKVDSASHFYGENKFKNSGWYSFFEELYLPKCFG